MESTVWGGLHKTRKLQYWFKRGSHISWHDLGMELKGHDDRALISGEFPHLYGPRFSHTMSQISHEINCSFACILHFQLFSVEKI